jgi:hypothetical protein
MHCKAAGKHPGTFWETLNIPAHGLWSLTNRPQCPSPYLSPHRWLFAAAVDVEASDGDDKPVIYTVLVLVVVTALLGPGLTELLGRQRLVEQEAAAKAACSAGQIHR